MEGANLEEAECPLVRDSPLLKGKSEQWTSQVPFNSNSKVLSAESLLPSIFPTSPSSSHLPGVVSGVTIRGVMRINCYRSVIPTKPCCEYMFLSNPFTDGVKCSYHRTCIGWGWAGGMGNWFLPHHHIKCYTKCPSERSLGLLLDINKEIAYNASKLSPPTPFWLK